MTTKQWLKVFFQEKNLPFAQWDISASDGMTHFIDNDFVINAIHGASLDEQKQIQSVLRKLDFANADVNDFLKHLARGLIETQITNG